MRARAFYTHHRRHPELTYSDRVIRSPRVPVFRDDRGALPPEPYPVSFLTAAAPTAPPSNGVFGNDPGPVAETFATALHERPFFERVVFAVLDRAAGTPTYSAFARVFAA